jgi:hypothetical protein
MTWNGEPLLTGLVTPGKSMETLTFEEMARKLVTLITGLTTPEPGNKLQAILPETRKC